MYHQQNEDSERIYDLENRIKSLEERLDTNKLSDVIVNCMKNSVDD